MQPSIPLFYSENSARVMFWDLWKWAKQELIFWIHYSQEPNEMVILGISVFRFVASFIFDFCATTVMVSTRLILLVNHSASCWLQTLLWLQCLQRLVVLGFEGKIQTSSSYSQGCPALIITMLSSQMNPKMNSVLLSNKCEDPVGFETWAPVLNLCLLW